MMFPKHKTIRDPKLRKQIKIEVGHCEVCGGFSYGATIIEAAHIIAKGMGGCNGPDIRENFVVACGPAPFYGCHGKSHDGLIPADKFWQVAAEREGISVDECQRRVRRAMGYDV